MSRHISLDAQNAPPSSRKMTSAATSAASSATASTKSRIPGPTSSLTPSLPPPEPPLTASCPTPAPSAGSGRSVVPPASPSTSPASGVSATCSPSSTTSKKLVTLREGNTPLYDLPRSARSLGLNWLLAKHQGMNPTGSFKDTGMTAALSVAAQRGFEWVACASTGNTSAALAAYAARAGLRSIVFIPEGKIAWASSRRRWTTVPSPSSSRPTSTAVSESSTT